METTSRPQQEHETSSPTNSPHINESTTNNHHHHHQTGSTQIQTPPITPKTISRSDTNPYPTTFVQADSTNFKQVVQMLTGSPFVDPHLSATAPPTPQPPPPTTTKNSAIPPIRTTQKKQSFKLYERRNSLKNGLMINPNMHNFVQASGFLPLGKPEILSPSILDFPALALSPVTPLREEDWLRISSAGSSLEDEEKAIAEKGFYMHPSPMSTPRAAEPPQLLPLFPVTSPRS